MDEWQPDLEAHKKLIKESKKQRKEASGEIFVYIEEEEEETEAIRIRKMHQQRKMREDAYLRQNPSEREIVEKVRIARKQHKGYLEYLEKWRPGDDFHTFKEWKNRKEEE